MRVVNSIEKEMVQSEWENWLADENLRCEQVKMMLSDKSNSSANNSAASNSNSSTSAAPLVHGGGQQQKVMRPIDEKRIESLREWHTEYCGSCRSEKDQILKIRTKMVDL